MTPTRALAIQVRKEVRALLPVWLVCLAAISISAVFGGPGGLFDLGDAPYFIGALTLGALSFGHEYHHRTLGLVLAQPVHRDRVMLVKFGVLAAMLLVLARVERIRFDLHNGLPTGWHLPTGFISPVAAGLLVAPTLTMLSRSPLAAGVFTAVLPLVMVALQPVAPTPVLQIALCGISALAGYWMFGRLEVIEGSGRAVRLPAWLGWGVGVRAAAPTFTRRRPAWLLVKKELRLQYLACVIAALYVIACLAARLLGSLGYLHVLMTGDGLDAFSALYIVFLPLLIGSLASAEERQLGTAEWQTLLPMASSRQWMLKVAVALGLTVLLAIGVPTLTRSLLLAVDHVMRFGMIGVTVNLSSPGSVGPLAFSVVLLTMTSLYVSSLCGSGLRALLISLLVVPFAGTWVGGVSSMYWVRERAFDWALLVEKAMVHVGWTVSPFTWSLVVTPALVLAGPGFVVFVLRLAMMNHRSAERGAKHVWMQAIQITAYATIATILVVIVRQGSNMAGSRRFHPDVPPPIHQTIKTP